MRKFYVLIFGLFMFFSAQSQTKTVEFTTTGNHTFTVPCGVTSIKVEVWGAGGHGGRMSSSGYGGGGGGGAYSSSVLTVSPGNIYNLSVGQGASGNNTSSGEDSWFSTNKTVMAKGGSSVGNNSANGANGGQASNGYGTTRVSGQNGGNAVTNGNNSGRRGGNGGDGADPGGGNGGTGRTYSQGQGEGTNGSQPGGGGGGAYRNKSTYNGGAGGNGKVVITYTGMRSDYCGIDYIKGGFGQNFVRPITYVEFAGISNRTSASTNASGYEKFCNFIGQVSAGGNYPIKVEGNTVDTYLWGDWRSDNEDYITVFIDWNQNGLFESSEMYQVPGYLTHSNGDDGQSVTGNISVPADAKLGQTLMRVIKSFDHYRTNACGTEYNYGQAEDYIIEVSGGCQQPTGATADNQTSLTVCENTQVDLRQTGGTLGPDQVWKWYIGSPSGTFVDNSSLSDGYLEVTPTETTTYYVRAEGGTCGTTGAGETVTVTVNKMAGISLYSGSQNIKICINSGAITPVVYSITGGANNATIVSGSLPNGVTGSYSSGKFTISGTPTQTGTFNYIISPTGNAPCDNSTISGSIEVLEKLAGLSYTSNNISYCKDGNITPNVPTLTSGTATSFTVSPSLPAGLVINSTTGIISGTPTVAQASTKYTITASNGSCSVVKDINIEVSATTSQAFNLSPSGLNEICSVGGSVHITLSGSETGKYYQLYLNGVAVSGALKSGTNSALDFGNFTNPGDYTIRTTDACATQMNGVVTIQVTPQPNTDFAYDGNRTSFCKDEGTTGEVTFTGAPTTGTFTASSANVKFVDSTTGEIDLIETIPGTYTIYYNVAASGGCGTYIKSRSISITASAQVFQVIGGGAYCDGSPAPEIKLNGSVSGVSYQLYRDGVTIGSAISGTGNEINFGRQSVNGNYTVMASAGTGVCETEMDGEVQVVKNPKPAQVNIIGGSSTICRGTVLPLKATAGTPISSTTEVTFQSTNSKNISIPDYNAQGMYLPVSVTSIPAGAVVEEISVYFKITGGRASHLRINLKGPNGNVLNIANGLGGNNAIYRNGTTISSTATNDISSSNANPRSGTYAPQAADKVDGATILTSNKSNVLSFNGLYDGTSIGVNGTWMLSVRDVSKNYTSTLEGKWTIKIKYSVTTNPMSVVWSTDTGLFTDLYTDPGGEFDPYYGAPRELVYLHPSTSGSKQYKAVATNEFGCSTTASTTVNVNPAPVLTLQADYCADISNDNIVITATSDIDVKTATWQWSGYDQLVSTGKKISTIKTKTAGTFYVSAESSASNGCVATGSMSIAQELVVNGNFEDEFEVGQFETGYTYVNSHYVTGNNSTGMYPEGTYTVDRDPNDYHFNFWGTDHTLGNGQGKFLIVNGKTNSTTTIWRQTVNVTPNTPYYFSAWAVALNDDGGKSAQANFSFFVNGVKVGDSTGHLPTKTANNESGTWVRFYGTWNSGSSTEAIIEIVNLTPNAGGNDFGLDDISFGTLSTFFNQTSEPATAAQVLCEDSQMATITFEAGGKGDAPILTWTATTPSGIDYYWNGRDYLLRGFPETPGTYNYQLKLEVCDNQYLTKSGTIEIKGKPNPGSFKDAIGNAYAICYNSPGTVELENTVGDISKWQSSTDQVNWSDVANVTTTYNYGALTNELYLRAFANYENVKGCVAKESQPVKLAFRNVWEGNSTSNWNAGSNWSFSTVPATGCDYVIIPDVGAKPYPVLTGNVQVANLIMKGNSRLTVPTTTKLSVAGQIQSDAGSKIDIKQGIIEFNGASNQFISSGMFMDTAINQLIVSNTNGSTLNVTYSAGDKSLAVTDKITFGSINGKLNSGDNITLKSTKAKTASLGVVGQNNAVSGKFTVERYINSGISSGEHGKKWLFIATPTGYDGNGQNIKESWMEGGNNASTGYGINLTGPEGVAGGWDATSSSPAIKEYNELTNLWKRASSANIDLYNPKGWMVFVRGDRSVSDLSADANPTNLRSKGALQTGNVPFNIPADNTNTFFTSIGNPYASAVDMRKVLTGSTESFTVWDPYALGEFGLGAYQTYTKVEGDFIRVPVAEGVKNNFILSGQAFFVQRNVNARTITFNESAKDETSANTTYFRAMGDGVGLMRMLKTNIYSNQQLEDGTLHVFGSEYSSLVDKDDARKMLNSGVNLSIKVEDKLLVVERKQPIINLDTIFFNLTGTVNGQYRFVFDATNLVTPGLEAWLEDTYNSNRHPVNLEGTTEVEFEVTSAAASKAAGRFRIVFAGQQALPVTYLKVNALKDGTHVNVQWTVAQEIGVKKYVVVKSTDGKQFNDIASVAANGSNNYMSIDTNLSDGYNYYRIRSIDLDGKESYSEIVKVFVGSAEPALKVFPNPITDGQVNLRLENYPAGKYQVRLINNGGQVMLTRNFDHAGGNYLEKIPWDYKYAHGNYNLEVRHPDGSVKVIVVMY